MRRQWWYTLNYDVFKSVRAGAHSLSLVHNTLYLGRAHNRGVCLSKWVHMYLAVCIGVGSWGKWWGRLSTMEIAVNYNESHSFQRFRSSSNTFNFFAWPLFTDDSKSRINRQYQSLWVFDYEPEYFLKKVNMYFDNLRKPTWSQYLSPARKF